MANAHLDRCESNQIVFSSLDVVCWEKFVTWRNSIILTLANWSLLWWAYLIGGHQSIQRKTRMMVDLFFYLSILIQWTCKYSANWFGIQWFPLPPNPIMDKWHVVLLLFITSFPCRYRQKADFAGPKEVGNTYTPVRDTCRLVKWI